MRSILRISLLVCVASISGGCATGNLLHEYDYQGATLGVVSEIPARPDVLSGSLFDLRSSGDPLRDALRVGARVAREVSAAELQSKLDSAATQIDVGHVLESDTHERAARYLGSEPAQAGQPSDYLLELVVVDYGVVADAWDAPAEFFIEADATLLEAASGYEIWRAEVGARDPIGPAVYGGPQEVRDVLTAAVLATLDVAEIVGVLDGLADFSARVVTDRLRDDLREARRR